MAPGNLADEVVSESSAEAVTEEIDRQVERFQALMGRAPPTSTRISTSTGRTRPAPPCCGWRTAWAFQCEG